MELTFEDFRKQSVTLVLSRAHTAEAAETFGSSAPLRWRYMAPAALQDFRERGAYVRAKLAR